MCTAYSILCLWCVERILTLTLERVDVIINGGGPTNATAAFLGATNAVVVVAHNTRVTAYRAKIIVVVDRGERNGIYYE